MNTPPLSHCESVRAMTQCARTQRARMLAGIRKELRGDRNQCCGCGEYFNSTFAFDKHRTGEHGKDRRCLSPDEMRAKGMAVNAAGFWISVQRDPCFFVEAGDRARGEE